MKTIRLPEENIELIDIVKITPFSSGLILAYKQNKPVGYVVFNEKDFNWYFLDTIDISSYVVLDENLSNLCTNLVTIGCVDTFKFLEFT